MNKATQFVKPVSYPVLILVLFLIPLFTKDAYLLHILIMTGINIILAISLRAIATTGQMSLAHAGFMAIGAYTSALLVTKLGLSFWVALPLGGIACVLRHADIVPGCSYPAHYHGMEKFDPW
jgi:ABC-type branched-subunit amino acid transport system permease subunit